MLVAHSSLTIVNRRYNSPSFPSHADPLPHPILSQCLSSWHNLQAFQRQWWRRRARQGSWRVTCWEGAPRGRQDLRPQVTPLVLSGHILSLSHIILIVYNRRRRSTSSCQTMCLQSHMLLLLYISRPLILSGHILTRCYSPLYQHFCILRPQVWSLSSCQSCITRYYSLV